MTDNGSERTKKYDQRRRNDGSEIRVALWVPHARSDEIKSIAAAMRAEANIAAGRPSPPPPILIPEIDIPEVPPAAWVWLKIKKGEKALRLIVKKNGGIWCSSESAGSSSVKPKKAPDTWRLREDVAARLQLMDRVIYRQRCSEGLH